MNPFNFSRASQSCTLRYRHAALLGVAAFVLGTAQGFAAEAQNRWTIQDDGSIAWNIKRGSAHEDNVEMSGEQVSVIVTYAVDKAGVFTIKRHIVFPMLRFAPNKTRHHLALEFGEDASPRIFFGDTGPLQLVANRIQQKGILRAEGTLGRNREVGWTRSVFPSTTQPFVIEKVVFTNRAATNVTMFVEDNKRFVSTRAGIYGPYAAASQVIGVGEKILKPGETAGYTVLIAAQKVTEAGGMDVNIDEEEKAREARVEQFLSRMQLETPDRVLNTAFDFAKIRGAESIYRTKGGLLHSPGGGAYYAAVWANDQAEYANPFFGFLGDNIATESAINSYRLFARYMNPDYKAIPSSIISEGADFWHGARDRGDMAMIAYGASRFALANGNRDTAAELWPLIEWSLEYCKRKVTDKGVVASDSDELENRFPSGKANLCTSSLYYDALNSAVMLGKELGKPQSQLDTYAQQAAALRAAINSHFGAKVAGFETYRYYDKADTAGHAKFAKYANQEDVLRAWICIPLTVGIYDRADGTIAALFSPQLWTPDGLATEAGQITFWDRSTLYALRGVFAAGATEKALDYLKYYSNRRLLGDHVPYPVEAYPEGNQRHLSAESALYCRVYTEGLFGMRPTGFRSFTCTPRLPKDWPGMSLKKIKAFGGDFDLAVTRAANKLNVQVSSNGKVLQTATIDEGGTARINLAGN